MVVAPSAYFVGIAATFGIAGRVHSNPAICELHVGKIIKKAGTIPLSSGFRPYKEISGNTLNVNVKNVVKAR